MIGFGINPAFAGEPITITQIKNIDSGNALKLYEWVKSNNTQSKATHPQWAKVYYSVKLKPITFLCYELSDTPEKRCELYTAVDPTQSREGVIAFSVDSRDKTQKSFIDWIIANTNSNESSFSSRSFEINNIVITCSMTKDHKSGTCELLKK